ncbi:unnamed protein product [Cunninghamella echinulata]
MLFQVKNNTKKNSCKSSPILLCKQTTLPNEIISNILLHLPTQNLLQLYLLNNAYLLSQLAGEEIIKRFEQGELGLRLYFDQESRWRYTLDVKLSQQDTYYDDNKKEKQRLVFVPMVNKKNEEMRFYNSKVLRRPMLYKVTMISSKESGDSLNNLPDNLLHKSYAMDIKQMGRSTLTDTSLLSLNYTIHETPSHIIKQRSGERLFFPTSFQCDLDWLCQTKSLFSKWVDLLHAKPQRRPMSSNLHFTMTEKLPFNGKSQRGQVAEINTLHSHHHHLSFTSSVNSKSTTNHTILVPSLVGH